MRRTAAAAIVAAIAVLGGCSGCKDKRDAPKSDTPPAMAAPDAGIDDKACTDAIAAAAAGPPYARAAALLHCTVCGEWRPILDWNVMSTDGGPSRLELDRALERCNAACDRAAMKKMASALDTSRGGDSRGPWRLLGESCHDKVSAVPDARNMTAPLFALDRIGRAIGARGSELSKQLAALEVTIPAVTVSGIGPVLASGGTKLHPAGPDAISLLGPELRLGVLPHATLGATGVTVTGNYPGEVTTDLAAAVAKLGPIAIVVPSQTPATKLVEIVAKTGRLETTADPTKPAAKPVELVVASPTAPPGWQVPAAIPVALNGKIIGAHRDVVITDMKVGVPTPPYDRPIRIEIGALVTVEDLARVLAKLADSGVTQVEIVAQGKP